MASKFADKTKADLVAIARMSGLLKTTISQKMSKAELLEYLEKADNDPEFQEALAAKAKEVASSKRSGQRSASHRRGRRKAQTEAPASVTESAPQQAEQLSTTTPAPAEQQPRRRRGRPRKKELNSQQLSLLEDVSGDEAAMSSALPLAEAEKKTPLYRSSESETVAVREEDVLTAAPAESMPESASAEEERENERAERDNYHSRHSRGNNPEEPRGKRKRQPLRAQAGEGGEENTQYSGHEQRRGARSLRSREEKQENTEATHSQDIRGGVLEIMPDGYGFIRLENYIQGPHDLYLPAQYIRRFDLRNGDYVSGPCRQQRETDRYPALYYIKEVNGQSPDKMLHRPHFDRLTPVYPNERYTLETTREEFSTRLIDLMAPIGKGQRGMIVSPPKAGKTILLQKIANAITHNNPSARLIVLLIDERPEEVTDMQRSIQGEVVYSTFDKTPENHVKISELVLERAERLVEMGEDVVILLDSITRMGRAYNLSITPTGRTLSGGLDPGALYGPKRFFGAARNIENGGSLTIIATALIETGSRMDEVIFEEFKGTGNMEVILDRKLAEKRIFPAIDINRSGTRREELLLNKKELDAVWGIRRSFGQLETSVVTETILSLFKKTRNNQQFIDSINVSLGNRKAGESLRPGQENGDHPMSAPMPTPPAAVAPPAPAPTEALQSSPVLADMGDQ